MNLCAKELKRNINFQAKLNYIFSNEEEQKKKLKIEVKVIDYDEGNLHMWDMKKFSNRYFLIKDILDSYFETNEIPNFKKEDDPFWDPPEPYFMGQVINN